MQREPTRETIRKFRAERKLSREMLAEQTGISVSHLEKIENNLRNPSMKTYVRLRAALCLLGAG